MKFLLSLLFLRLLTIKAQEITTSLEVSCGDSVESEFTQPIEIHEYNVPMNAGDKLNITIVPIGAYLFTALPVLEPAGNEIIYNFEVEASPVAATDILSGRGNYKIHVYNYPRESNIYSNNYRKPTENGRAGVYTLFVGCTLRDGTEVPAGGS
jgi:hypothetical protein